MIYDKTLLVLGPRYTDDSNNLWRAALDKNWNYLRLTSYRLEGKKIGEIREYNKVVFYGDTLLYDAIKNDIGLTIVQPNDAWLTELPYEYVKRKVGYVPFWVATQLKDVFVKPPDAKVFTAKVYGEGELANGSDIHDNFMCIISEPVDFVAEYRFFTRHRKIVDHSSYLINGELDFSQKSELAVAFAESLLRNSDVDVPLSMTLDVGLMDNGAWAVVEANQSWASGLYGCDPALVLDSLSIAALSRGQPKDLVHWKWLRHN